MNQIRLQSELSHGPAPPQLTNYPTFCFVFLPTSQKSHPTIVRKKTALLTRFPSFLPEEEEEEEEESDDEGQELSLPSDAAAVLGEESLEPPAKLARTDQRVLFTTGSAEN